MKNIDTLVYIGRFQPFHNGHKSVVEQALLKADQVLILVGSPNISRSARNPFSAEERISMIQRVFDNNPRIIVKSVEDDLYNMNVWLSAVQRATEGMGKIGLIGFKRDHSSFYLDMFPQWDLVEVEEFRGINATEIRERYFRNWSDIINVPVEVAKFLANWSTTDSYWLMSAEWKFIRDYKRAWEIAPYPPIFVTVDAVLVHSGHILLIKRGETPGKGLWALPGGFINQNERLEDACIRELKEETKVKLPEKVIRGSKVTEKVFDDPNRSDRGRTITHAFFYEIPSGELPKVKGDDDAAEAAWVPIGDLPKMATQMFEDHGFIINYFLGKGIQ